MAAQGVTCRRRGEYGVGMVFLPKEHASRLACEQELERAVRAEGQVLLGWRDVPVDRDMPMSPGGAREGAGDPPDLHRPRPATSSCPMRSSASSTSSARRPVHAIQRCSSRTARSTTCPVDVGAHHRLQGPAAGQPGGEYYRDLAIRGRVGAGAGAPALLDQHLPEWAGASVPLIAHNGEINTVQGQLNWMRARQGVSLAGAGRRPEKLWPLIYPGQSDSATFDNALELLDHGGYSLAHAMMMMIPEAWESAHADGRAKRRAFYEYHAAMMEPWDGPAAMVFTDGRQIGATLDRNGLRPARYSSPTTTWW
jgi:glutamate synthase (NADPH) large chain